MSQSTFNRVLLVLAAAAALYTITAVVGQIVSEGNRAGCERGNLQRQEMFKENNRSIRTNAAISRALVWGPNATGIRFALARDSRERRAAKMKLTIGDYPHQPWKVNCEAAYPYPLPWPS
jgi:hypothetical protein